MSDIKLKPCPFCGFAGQLVRHTFYGVYAKKDEYGVECTYCEAKTWPSYDTKDDAIKAWNGRVNHE